MNKIKIIEDLWGELHPELGQIFVMVSDCEGLDFSVANISISDKECNKILSMPDEIAHDYLYDFAFEITRELGYVLSGYVDNDSDTVV